MAHDAAASTGGTGTPSPAAGLRWHGVCSARFAGAPRAALGAPHDALCRAWSSRRAQPVFYADWGVPDSRDGRLEMVQPARRSCSCAGCAARAQAGRELAQSAVRPHVRGPRSASARMGRGRPVGRQAGEEAGAELSRPGGRARPAAGRRRAQARWCRSCGATSIREVAAPHRRGSSAGRLCRRRRSAGSRRRTATCCQAGRCSRLASPAGIAAERQAAPGRSD